MPIADTEQFTHSHRALKDGAVTFRCSADNGKWPWLLLDPFDPIVVQTINFWAASGASAARGTLDPTKWTALTQTEWTCGVQGAGHATHGIAEPDGPAGGLGYRLTFFDADGALVYRMSGTGVVFQNRNFEAWRSEKKHEVAATAGPGDFAYAPIDDVGVQPPGVSFLAELGDAEIPSASGLITRENGFPPGHPYLSGSGDHVNATHLAEAGRQFASLLNGGAAQNCIGGEMDFKHFVELGAPFHVTLVERNDGDRPMALTVHQADRLCARIMLSFA
ncbi:MAG: hypothetical protein AAFW97_03650 [Pseudomonadota bacterium]